MHPAYDYFVGVVNGQRTPTKENTDKEVLARQNIERYTCVVHREAFLCGWHDGYEHRKQQWSRFGPFEDNTPPLEDSPFETLSYLEKCLKQQQAILTVFENLTTKLHDSIKHTALPQNPDEIQLLRVVPTYYHANLLEIYSILRSYDHPARLVPSHANHLAKQVYTHSQRLSQEMELLNQLIHFCTTITGAESSGYWAYADAELSGLEVDFLVGCQTLLMQLLLLPQQIRTAGYDPLTEQ